MGTTTAEAEDDAAKRERGNAGPATNVASKTGQHAEPDGITTAIHGPRRPATEYAAAVASNGHASTSYEYAYETDGTSAWAEARDERLCYASTLKPSPAQCSGTRTKHVEKQ